MPDTLTKSKGLVRFTVLGNNWKNEIELNAKNFKGMGEVFVEASTLGTEAFLGGSYSTIDPELPVGFGSVIIVERQETKKAASVCSDIVLANAGCYKESAELKRIIDERKKNK